MTIKAEQSEQSEQSEAGKDSLDKLYTGAKLSNLILNELLPNLKERQDYARKIPYTSFRDFLEDVCTLRLELGRGTGHTYAAAQILKEYQPVAGSFTDKCLYICQTERQLVWFKEQYGNLKYCISFENLISPKKYIKGVRTNIIIIDGYNWVSKHEKWDEFYKLVLIPMFSIKRADKVQALILLG